MSELDSFGKLLSNAPREWPRLRLGQLGNIVAGGTPSRNVAAFWQGEHPWVTPGEITKLTGKYISETEEKVSQAGIDASAATILPVGSVLVTTRATIGAAALNTVPMSTNQGFKSLIPTSETDSTYLYYLTKLISPELVRRASGSTFLEISKKDFEAVIVPRPPLPEQRRIAAILDTLDRTIEGTQRVIEKLQATRQGLLHDLLTRGLDERGRLRDPERNPEQFKETELGRVPREWEVGELGVLLSGGGGVFQTGPFGSQLHAREYVPEGVPVVMPQDMVEGSISEDAIARITPERANSLSRHKLRVNDVLFSRRGDLSRCAVVTHREVGWICGTGCLLARFPATTLLGDWLALVYTHDFGQRQVAARAVGSTMVNLNTGLLSGLILPFPTIQEQASIVARINAHDNRLLKEKTRLAKLQALKRGLMEDLLTGRMRVAVAAGEVGA